MWNRNSIISWYITLLNMEYIIQSSAYRSLLLIFVASRVVRPNILYLTDGNPSSVELAAENGRSLSQDCVSLKLDWENSEDFHTLLSSSGRAFDVIVGSELLYYRTDPKVLVEALNRVATESAVFVHSHVIRVSGQGQELVSQLEASGWETYEIPIDLVAGEELAHHSEWHSARCLLSLKQPFKSTMKSDNNILTSFPAEIQSLCIPFLEIGKFSEDNCEIHDEATV